MTNLQIGFHPKLLSSFREGYSWDFLRADVVAALTVAIVALPLSMAIAIGSHVSPERGLYTAIVGGFIISALGGSRFQIGGPAGAFIVLVASLVDRQGMDGLLLATFMAGAIIFVVGALQLGTYIRYVPHAVTVGFTTGIAVIIFASQLKEIFGLTLPHGEPAALIPKFGALFSAWPSLNFGALAVAVLTVAIIVVIRNVKPTWPGFLIAVVVASLITLLTHAGAETIASRFGGIPSSLPAPHLPEFTMARLWTLLPDALSLAFLGSIESLLSAVVADRMSGRQHRSNTELVAQGLANMASALFGGMVATGTIARTATNVRAGAKSPLAGMFHSIFLLAFMLMAAPLAGYVPLAALAGVLAVVCWNMADGPEAKRVLLSARGPALAFLVTFLVTIFEDLTTGIISGMIIFYGSKFLFERRKIDEAAK